MSVINLVGKECAGYSFLAEKFGRKYVHQSMTNVNGETVTLLNVMINENHLR